MKLIEEGTLPDCGYSRIQFRMGKIKGIPFGVLVCYLFLAVNGVEFLHFTGAGISEPETSVELQKGSLDTVKVLDSFRSFLFCFDVDKIVNFDLDFLYKGQAYTLCGSRESPMVILFIPLSAKGCCKTLMSDVQRILDGFSVRKGV